MLNAGAGHTEFSKTKSTFEIPAVIKITLTLVLTLSLSSGAASLHADSWKGQSATQDGVLQVTNPSKSIEKPSESSLKELWRLGGDSDDEDEFFGLITQIMTDESGNIYVLDSQLHEIKIYDASGEFLNSIGREGEGPGEFRQPSTMFFMPSGDIAVMQTVPGKIVLLTREGDPAGDFPIPEPEGGGFQILRGGNLSGENVVLQRMTQKVDQDKGEIKLFFTIDLVNPKGEILVTLENKPTSLSFANTTITEDMFDTFENRWKVAKDGRVYACTLRDEYNYKVWGANGTLERVVSRNFTAYKRTDEQVKRTEDIWAAFTRRVPGSKLDISKTDKSIHTIYPREDGSVWVLGAHGSRTQPDGCLGIFDVFDGEGRFTRQVSLMGQGDPQEDAFFFMGDRLFVVTGFLNAAVAAQGGLDSEDSEEDEPTPMEIICYQLDAPVVASGK